MKGFLRITKLDFFSMKSQFVSYLSLVFIFLVFGYMGSSVIWLCINAAWFSALMSSVIFVTQEKNNLDRLYGSVSVSLNEIVLGRYIFVFLNYVISFLVIVALYISFALFQNKSFELLDIILGFSLSFMIFSAITGMQIPLFFKMGYTKARFWSMVPFVMVMGFVVVPSFVSALSRVVEFMQSHQSVLIIGGILVSCMIQFLSYQIAVVFYRKRKRG